MADYHFPDKLKMHKSMRNDMKSEHGRDDHGACQDVHCYCTSYKTTPIQGKVSRECQQCLASHRCLNVSLKKFGPSFVNPQMLGSFISALTLFWGLCGCRQALFLVLFTSAGAELLTPLFCKYRIKSQPQIDREALQSFNQRRHLISQDRWKHLGECARPPFLFSMNLWSGHANITFGTHAGRTVDIKDIWFYWGSLL